MDTTEKEIEMGTKDISTKLKLPKEVKERIYTKIAKEFWMTILIFAYFLFLNYGYGKIEPKAFNEDLKICAGLSIICTITVFEIAYRKDNGEIAMHGVEMLGLSILTLFMPYVYFHRGIVVKFLYSFSSMYIAIYYSIKALIIYEIEVKKYFIGLSDVKEIVVEEETSYLDEPNERKFAEIRHYDEEIETKISENKRNKIKFNKFKKFRKKTEEKEDKVEEKTEEEPKIEETKAEEEPVEEEKKEENIKRKKAPRKRKKKEVKTIMAKNREKNKENGDKEND